MIWLVAAVGVVVAYLLVKEWTGGKGTPAFHKMARGAGALALTILALLLAFKGKFVVALPVAGVAYYLMRSVGFKPEKDAPKKPSSAGAGAQRRAAAQPPVMSVAEAREVLGVAEGASTEEIKAAHKRLMVKMHPDHGGSTYLAAKINAAKDLLLQVKG